MQVVTPTDLISPYDADNVKPRRHGIDSLFLCSDHDWLLDATVFPSLT